MHDRIEPGDVMTLQPRAILRNTRCLIGFVQICACLFVFLGQTTLAASQERTLTLGVLSVRPKPETMSRWQPLADYLSSKLDGYQVTLLPLDQEELEVAMQQDRLDLLFTNASDYIRLSSKNNLSGALVTLANQVNGRPVSSLAGVIFTKSDRSDINTLKDLKGRKVACFSTTGGLGSYPGPILEFMKSGIRFPGNATLVTTGTPMDRVVEAVLNGKADAGFMRTGVLEDMVRQGALDIKSIKVLNRQNTPGFPFLHSTALYPEWPIVAMPRLPEEVSRKIASALLTLEPDSQVARKAGIYGFTIPADYMQVEKLLRELRLAPFDTTPHVSPSLLWQHYKWWIIALF